jgi:hypothetical protein
METWNWKEHLPLLIGLASTLLVALRLLAVAGFDEETAYGILQAAGTASIIVGAFIPVIGLIAISIGVLLIMRAPTEERRGLFKSTFLVYAAGLALMIGTLTAPIGGLILLGSAMLLGTIHRGILWVIARRQGKNKRAKEGRAVVEQERPGFPSIGGRLIAMYSVLAIAAVVILAPPWMPAERISVKGDDIPITGFILSKTPTDVVILNGASRQIAYLKTQDIVEQMPCITRKYLFQENPAEFVYGFKPQYIPCPF